MVVDDAAFMRMKASKLLAENGHIVVEASNGAEALVKPFDATRIMAAVDKLLAA